MANATPAAQPHAKLLNATDDFIGETLPAWLTGANAGQLKTLRSCFKDHYDSQQQVRDTVRELKPLHTFAKDLLAPALKALLAQAVDLDRAQWRERVRRAAADPGQGGFYYRYGSALQRFMQNFAAGQSFFPGSALVYPAGKASEQVLSEQADKLVALCRRLDIGASYQKHLDEVFDDSFVPVLATDRRRQLALATQIALLKGQLMEGDHDMLLKVIGKQPVRHTKSLTVVCGELNALGARVDGALAFELQGSWGHSSDGVSLPQSQVRGVILFLPDDREQSLRHYDDWEAASHALGLKMRTASYRDAFSQRIALSDRAAYLTTLGKRLKDPQTDMQVSLSVIDGDLFEGVASQHLQRIRDDARFLAVPTAQVDAAASSARLKALETAGLVLLNLAALFVPGVGEVLLADFIRQTLVESFEGIEDWSQGHQHEALEHLLNVAQSVAVTGTTMLAASVVRSAFVDGLVPVNNREGAERLWSDDLTHYAVEPPPENLLEQDNGLLSDGRSDWWRDAQGYHYRVSANPQGSGWQLRHPTRELAYAPLLEGNGERAWRLTSERPLEWQGARLLLARLWPEVLRLDEDRIGGILAVAGADQSLLRGLLVENRPLPVALRDTLERFAVEARIETFIEQLGEGQATDTELLQWSIDKLALDGEDLQEQYASILEQVAAYRGEMLDEVAARYLRQDPQLALIKRDFPGLPDAYALRLLEQASGEARERMIGESRIPLAVAEQARSLLRLAQLVRMREGLYLRGSYRAETVELAFALLRRNAGLPFSLNLELREGSDAGRVLARLHPDSGAGQNTTVMVWRDGRFSLYDQQGRAMDVELAEPGGLPEALVACLPPAQLQRLGWTGDYAGELLLADLRAWLPADDQALSRLVGLRDIRPWHVPLQRLADGRPGYLLNGRRSSQVANQQMLRDRVRALYSGFNDAEVDRFVALLMQRPRSAFSNLLRHEHAYRQLDETLQLWEVAEQDIARRDLRRLVANQFRRSWRLEGDRVSGENGEAEGLRLSVIGIPVASLPDLPQGADFSHVTDLTLVGLRLQELPQNFLHCFPDLRRLNLSNNALRAMPAGIAQLGRLRSLDLARNQIRMNTAGIRVVRNLVMMRTLDLSANPLGSVSLNFRQMSRLREISLRRCGLLEVPSGLEWCGFLEFADLRDNQISSVPQVLLGQSYGFRQGLDLSGNPLPVAVRQRLHAPDNAPAWARAVYALAPADGVVPLEGSRTQWLATQQEDLHLRRGEQWDALRAEPGSEGLFQLLQELTGSSDYRLARDDLGRRVWAVIEAATQSADLRAELFNLAGSERTCVDSVASCFSTLEVRVLVHNILRGTATERTRPALLDLARRLFRLDQVERLARADIEARQARREEVDEVEVSLAYRVGLRDELNLPGQPRTLQFGRIADVSRAQLDAAAAQVRAEEAGPALAEYISQRDFWISYLEQQHAGEFTSALAPYGRQFEDLEDESAGLGLSDGVYLQRCNQIASDRRKAQQAVVLRLTRRALDG
ncbi:NEL-type E3 ubiquitin ligase domain-containing protein [Pseudomonas xanthosomatis]|uniref:NEL-type E3 ubiquitin ligase domain-containing protein n=1 Tax=Pseudomonas xanthosomatis TaxID=2842356 RepID=UPI0035124470